MVVKYHIRHILQYLSHQTCKNLTEYVGVPGLLAIHMMFDPACAFEFSFHMDANANNNRFSVYVVHLLILLLV